MKRGSTSGLDLRQFGWVFNKMAQNSMASGIADEVESNRCLILKRKGFNDLSKNSRTFEKL